jgi:hypothetical protein
MLPLETCRRKNVIYKKCWYATSKLKYVEIEKTAKFISQWKSAINEVDTNREKCKDVRLIWGKEEISCIVFQRYETNDQSQRVNEEHY